MASPWIAAVLPAYAGMIRLQVDRLGDQRRAPRVCGDDPLDWIYSNLKVPCSPRMRG